MSFSGLDATGKPVLERVRRDVRVKIEVSVRLAPVPILEVMMFFDGKSRGSVRRISPRFHGFFRHLACAVRKMSARMRVVYLAEIKWNWRSGEATFGEEVAALPGAATAMTRNSGSDACAVARRTAQGFSVGSLCPLTSAKKLSPLAGMSTRSRLKRERRVHCCEALGEKPGLWRLAINRPKPNATLTATVGSGTKLNWVT